MATDLGPLQAVVSAIEAMSETADGLKDLLAHLQKHDELLVKNLPQLDDLLPVLDPPRHTLGMVYILCAAAPPPPRASSTPRPHAPPPTRVHPSRAPAATARRRRSR